MTKGINGWAHPKTICSCCKRSLFVLALVLKDLLKRVLEHTTSEYATVLFASSYLNRLAAIRVWTHNDKKSALAWVRIYNDSMKTPWPRLTYSRLPSSCAYYFAWPYLINEASQPRLWTTRRWRVLTSMPWEGHAQCHIIPTLQYPDNILRISVHYQ